MTAKAGCSLFAVDDPKHLLNESLELPRFLLTQASVNRKGSNFIISASGGVEIRPALSLEKTEPTNLSPVQRAATAPSNNKSWWWN